MDPNELSESEFRRIVNTYQQLLAESQYKEVVLATKISTISAELRVVREELDALKSKNSEE